jgi:hypothetical protein
VSWKNRGLSVLSPYFLLLGCSVNGPVYAPPAQFVMPTGEDPRPEVRMLKMSEVDALLNVIQGVPAAGRDERPWTEERATFQFRVRSLENTDFRMQFALEPVTMKQTGLVRITITADGSVFDSFVKTSPGDYEYRRAADRIPVRPYQPLIVTISIDPPYIAPESNTKFGILLTSIGFVPRS